MIQIKTRTWAELIILQKLLSSVMNIILVVIVVVHVTKLICSAKVTTAIAIACKASQILAKPGMGVDEGYMIVKNEMNRIIALANRRRRV